jgi:hypothetical protein
MKYKIPDSYTPVEHQFIYHGIAWKVVNNNYDNTVLWKRIRNLFVPATKPLN